MRNLMLRTRRTLAGALIGVLTLAGCAGLTYPAATPTAGQDALGAERDARECRERAAHETDSR